MGIIDKARAFSDRVRAQAWKTIGIAFAVGFVLGAIAASR